MTLYNDPRLQLVRNLRRLREAVESAEKIARELEKGDDNFAVPRGYLLDAIDFLGEYKIQMVKEGKA